jgi:hypothetical protein
MVMSCPEGAIGSKPDPSAKSVKSAAFWRTLFEMFFCPIGSIYEPLAYSWLLRSYERSPGDFISCFEIYHNILQMFMG